MNVPPCIVMWNMESTSMRQQHVVVRGMIGQFEHDYSGPPTAKVWTPSPVGVSTGIAR